MCCVVCVISGVYGVCCMRVVSIVFVCDEWCVLYVHGMCDLCVVCVVSGVCDVYCVW